MKLADSISPPSHEVVFCVRYGRSVRLNKGGASPAEGGLHA